MLSFQNSNGLFLVASLNFFRSLFVLRINSSFTHGLQSFLVISQHVRFPPNCLCISHSILHPFWTTCRWSNMSCYLPFSPHRPLRLSECCCLYLELFSQPLIPVTSLLLPLMPPSWCVISSAHPFHCSHTYTTWIRWPSPDLLPNPIHFFNAWTMFYLCLLGSQEMFVPWMDE